MEKVNLTVRLDRKMKEAVEEICKEKDITVSQLVRFGFRRFLNESPRDRQKTPEEIHKAKAQVATAVAFVRSGRKGGKKR